MRTLLLFLVALAAAFSGLVYFGLRGLGDVCTHHETAEDWL